VTLTDTRYLELHRGKWRVVVPVPRRLHDKLGTKLKRSLGTDSLVQANRLKHLVIAELRRQIDRASDTRPGDPLVEEALSLRHQLAAVRSRDEEEMLQFAVGLRAEELRGEPIGEDFDPDRGPRPVYDSVREKRAGSFLRIARGIATPIALEHEKFILQSATKKRTKGDDRRAIKLLLDWCERKGISPFLEAITKKVAVQFLDDLPGLIPGKTAVTGNKYVSRLRAYWSWLENRHVVDTNVWRGRRLVVAPRRHEEKPREFTDKEVKTLLEGPASDAMHDLMMIAALSGARLDAIVDLKVKDCANGRFIFKPQKKEPGPREVPIHSALKEIITRRTKGKAEGDDLFPEYPVPKANSQRERSFRAANQFVKYRRKVGVDDVISGSRRSRVTFHSFRRWFITKAEQADQSGDIIALVVGHKRSGMTLGTYSGGALFEQKRKCVEAVRLPAFRRMRRR